MKLLIELCPVSVVGSADPGQGLCLGERRRVGRFDRWASSPCCSFGRPCDLPGLSFELVSVCVVVPLVLPHRNRAVEVRNWACLDGSVARSAWTCTAISVWSRSARTASLGQPVGCLA